MLFFFFSVFLAWILQLIVSKNARERLTPFEIVCFRVCQSMLHQPLRGILQQQVLPPCPGTEMDQGKPLHTHTQSYQHCWQEHPCLCARGFPGQRAVGEWKAPCGITVPTWAGKRTEDKDQEMPFMFVALVVSEQVGSGICCSVTSRQR